MSAIGHQGVFRLNGWSRQIHTEFQGFRVTWEHARKPASYVYGTITLYGPAFQPASTSTLVSYFRHARQYVMSGPTTPCLQPLPGITQTRFSLLRFRSPLLSESRLFSLPPGTEMVHFPGFASPPYGFRWRCRVFPRGGFPHSDIPGSQPVCDSPRLFAADHVLLRLLAPRHPHTRP